MTRALRPGDTVYAAAPIRICDNGGWTDTWFAGHGSVFNIAVTPRVGVAARITPREETAGRVVLDVVNYAERYAFDPEQPPGRHPLLEAVVADIGVPDGVRADISVRSRVPPGSATGTSAAVAVALIGVLDAMTPGRMPSEQIARRAHRIEADLLGSESGIQDQLCAAFGGVNFIEISSYPHATVTQLQIPAATWAELEARLVLVYLGQAHVSARAHEQVIAAVRADQPATRVLLDQLRRAARDARDAVLKGDLPALGGAFRRNCDAQARLHPDLVGASAQKVIAVGAAQHALGWKVNGAGGAGGSVTLLCGGDRGSRRDLEEALHEADPQFAVIPIRLSRSGLRVRSRPRRSPPTSN